MLKKIMKYDLEYMFKTLGIFYIVTILLALLTRGLLAVDDIRIFAVIRTICVIATVILAIAIALITVLRMWMRFRDNLYKDESYLTHTLPVKKSTLYTSKMLTSIISVFATFIVLVVVLLITFYSKENVAFLKDIFSQLKGVIGCNYKTLLVIVGGLYLIEWINLLQIGFTGIILGHRKNSDKTIYSIVYGFIAYWIGVLFLFVSIVITAVFNKNLWNFMFLQGTVSYKDFGVFALIAFACYMLLMIIVYIINRKFLNKGVNVE